MCLRSSPARADDAQMPLTLNFRWEVEPVTLYPPHPQRPQLSFINPFFLLHSGENLRKKLLDKAFSNAKDVLADPWVWEIKRRCNVA